MQSSFIPSFYPHKISMENIKDFTNYLPNKSEIVDGDIFFDEGKIRVEDVIYALIYYIGLERTLKLIPKDFWYNSLDKIDIKDNKSKDEDRNSRRIIYVDKSTDEPIIVYEGNFLLVPEKEDYFCYNNITYKVIEKIFHHTIINRIVYIDIYIKLLKVSET